MKFYSFILHTHHTSLPTQFLIHVRVPRVATCTHTWSCFFSEDWTYWWSICFIYMYLKPNYDVRFMICSSIDLIMPIGFNQSSSTVQLQGKCSSQDPCTVFIIIYSLYFIELINNVLRDINQSMFTKREKFKRWLWSVKTKKIRFKKNNCYQTTVLIWQDLTPLLCGMTTYMYRSLTCDQCQSCDLWYSVGR